MRLDACREGEAVRIVRIDGQGALRRRLIDMGFTRGTEATIIRYAPLRDPMELRMKSCNISLRVCEAEKIEVER